MDTTKTTTGIETKVLLSTIWIFILFNIIFRDLHEFISPGFLEEALTGYVNAQKITGNLLLIGAFIAEIPIAMVLLSRILSYKVNRVANIIASIITIPVVISTVGDLDDIIFTSLEILALIAIIWYAWKWTERGV